MDELVTEQPAPTPRESPALWEMVVADLQVDDLVESLLEGVNEGVATGPRGGGRPVWLVGPARYALLERAPPGGRDPRPDLQEGRAVKIADRHPHGALPQLQARGARLRRDRRPRSHVARLRRGVRLVQPSDGGRWALRGLRCAPGLCAGRAAGALEADATCRGHRRPLRLRRLGGVTMETRCVAKCADRKQCRHPAAGWWVIDLRKVSPLCGTHANQYERAGARMRKVITCDGQVVGEARA